MAEPVDRLSQDDTAALGALDGTAFAPIAPRWPDAPGFWDECRVHGRSLSPGFTVTIMDADAGVIPLRLVSRNGTPAELIAEYRMGNGMTATEVRSVHPGGVFVSEWRLRALKPATVHLVAWTLAPAGSVRAPDVAFDGSLDWRDEAERRTLSLAALGESTSWVACAAGNLDIAPSWLATPLPELWAAERLPCAVRGPQRDAERSWCFAVHRSLRVRDAGGSATFALRVIDVAAPVTPPPTVALGHTLGGTSRAAWNAGLSELPHLSCSDPFIEAAWWRRWGGLFQHAERAAAMPALITVREGAASPVRLRALPAIVRELAWADPARARALVEHALAQRRRAGALPEVDGDATGPAAAPADWGGSLQALDHVAPDDGWVQRVHAPLGEHVTWMLDEAERIANAAGGADRAVLWGVMTWRAARWLEDAAERAGAPEQAGRWRETSARSGAVVARALGEVSVLRGPHPSAAPSALPFVVLGTDIPTREQALALLRALLDPDRFWTPYPVPARARGEIDARWRAAEALGNRDEPDAARVLPWLTCAIIDALVEHSAEAPELRASVAQLLRRFVRMHFADGDLRRPVSSGDFNPLTGEASAALEARSDQRSWLADLLVRVAAGVRPHAGGITVDPFPLGVERLELAGLRVRGRTLDVRVDAAGVTVTVDGVVHAAPGGSAIQLVDQA